MGFWHDVWYGADNTDTVIEQRSGSVNEPLPSDPSTALEVPNRSNVITSVSAKDALGLSAVYRAISIYSTAAQQLSIDVFRGGVTVEVAPSFIKRPDINETRPAFLEMTVVSLALNGNAYWLISRDAQSRVTNLEVLNPLDMNVETNTRGKVTNYKYMDGDYKPAEIQHLKLLRVPGSAKGLGPIQAAQVELHGTLSTRDYSQNWFETSGVPNGYLKTDTPMNADDALALKDQWHKSVKGGTTAVLDSGLTYTPIYLSPRDAQFIESQNFNKTQVATLFGIPLRMMLATVEGNSMTYANLQDEKRQFIEFSLMQYMKEIEEAFSALLPGSQVARFNFESFLRTDASARYATYATALAGSPFMTVEQVWEIEGWGPVPKSLTDVKEVPNVDATV